MITDTDRLNFVLQHWDRIDWYGYTTKECMQLNLGPEFEGATRRECIDQAIKEGIK